MYFDERNFNEEYETIINNIQNKKWDIDTINIVNMGRDNNELYGSNEGLNKGNMFKNLFDPYKNYVFKVMVNGKRDELLLRIEELTFKVIDLSLYLDIYDNDMEIYTEFKKTNEELKKNKELYEKEYGPLEVCETLYYDKYKWSNNPWPWMEKGDK